MTFAEIQEEINAYSKRRQDEIKLQRQLNAEHLFYLSHLIAHSFHKPDNLPKTVSEVFPELFKKQEKAVDWTVLKANMSALAEIHKRRRGGDD